VGFEILPFHQTLYNTEIMAGGNTRKEGREKGGSPGKRDGNQRREDIDKERRQKISHNILPTPGQSPVISNPDSRTAPASLGGPISL
jgi:hypothetical protein